MIFGLSFYPWRPPAIVYYNQSDQNGLLYDWSAWVNYSGPQLSCGLGSRSVAFHAGPESQRYQWLREGFASQDRDTWEGWVYLKYFNGRFFLNTEADWWYQNVHYGLSASGTSIDRAADNNPLLGGASFFSPRYAQSWRYMVELGAVSGPAKMSFLYAWLPGPDRRGGIPIDRQPCEIDPDDNRGVKYIYIRSAHEIQRQIAWDPERGNLSVFRPYSYLLCTSYGAGVNAFAWSGSGYMVDASVLAARLDYALAANINTYGSFFYARRNSHGYGWGFIRPGESVLTDLSTFSGNLLVVAPHEQIGSSGRVIYLSRSSATNQIPAIPDNDLGWEVDAGFDWKLLDSWTLNFVAAYWQPGSWFKYACVDKSIDGWNNPTSANSWGVNPDRAIDPIFAVDISMSVNF